MPIYPVHTLGARGFRAFPQYATKADLPAPKYRRTDVLYLVKDEKAAYYWDGGALHLLASGTDADDLIVVDTFDNLPATGDDDKLYVTRDTKHLYIWNTDTTSYDQIDSQLNYFDEARNDLDGRKGYSVFEAVNAHGESLTYLGFYLKTLGSFADFIVGQSIDNVQNLDTSSQEAIIFNPMDQATSNVASAKLAIILNEKKNTEGTSTVGERGTAINCVDTDIDSGHKQNTVLGCDLASVASGGARFFSAGSLQPSSVNSAWRAWALGYNPTVRGSSQLVISVGELNGDTTTDGTAQFALTGAKVRTTDDTPTTLVIDQESNETAPTNIKTATDGYYQFNCDFVVKNVTDSEISAFNVRFAIANNAGTAQLAGQLLFNEVELGAGIDANSVDVSIVNSNEVQVNATGVAGKTINWMASYKITEVNG